MKRTLLVFLSLLFYNILFSQTTYIITGKIIDAATKLPLQAASVFAQNTTIGTATGTEGSFRLELPNGGYALVVTFTGYQTEIRRITTADAADKNITIEMHQQQKELQDVVIRSSNEVKDGWEKYGSFFVENFIGKTENSAACVIQNTPALKFYFNKKRNRLKVLAEGPLEIINAALGYRIKYTLDSFTHEYSTQSTVYSGYPLFEEMKPGSPEERQKWEDNRRLAYNGSLLHFMRSLFARKLKEEGFELQFLVSFNDRENAITVKDIYGGMNYSKDDSTQIVEVIPNQKNVAVLYKNGKPSPLYLGANPDASDEFQLTILSFLPEARIGIEQNGYFFDQTDITVNQYLGWKKMADMVPYDYNR